MSKGIASVFPNAVGVTFRISPCYAAGPDAHSPSTFWTESFDIEELGVFEPVASQNVGDAKTVKVINSKALAYLNAHEEDPNNVDKLKSLAKQIAIDYCKWLQKSFDESFNQIIGPVIDGLTDTIEWTYRTNQIQTRRYSSPYNADPEEAFQHDPDACLDANDDPISETPCIVFYGPPAKCVSNKLVLTKYKVCLMGGDLIQTYIGEDTAS